ncbi:hypothetical protein 268TH004_3 [Bacillus phage 268TH004]|uniref:Uncharacterized protein n=2 Tax=Gettysburgvirus TaxID=3425034 RepID=A0A7T7ZAJ4_9CAUD|nr:hypothetical protein 019DV002_2 [Bacillus phage 019DV002]QFG05231.1 hypothetical protein 019DV004_2 [Bacillus phage 019DV004]QQO40349.1 hypothetical protein 268TH004_3 [Bacillus phage 268TH004]
MSIENHLYKLIDELYDDVVKRSLHTTSRSNYNICIGQAITLDHLLIKCFISETASGEVYKALKQMLVICRTLDIDSSKEKFW